jgi:ribosomal protein S18 acetylase RimI-like enzyme
VPEIRTLFPERADDGLHGEIHRVMCAVVDQGGAVGYDTPPSPDDTRRWLDDVLESVRTNTAVFAVATVDGRVEAMGLWRRGSAPFFSHSAEVQKMMAHPSARGRGLGGLIMNALISSAHDKGIETLTLGVRGNNHGAIELYEQHGFREWGRLPNVIAVGNERYDDVRMYLDLSRGPGVVLRGSSQGGPGSSPRRS